MLHLQESADQAPSYFKWLSGFIAIITLLFCVFLFYMRFHDGPIQIFSGGAFKTGELQTGAEPEWLYELKNRQDVETVAS